VEVLVAGHLTCVAAGGGAAERAGALAPLVSTARSCVIRRSRSHPFDRRVRTVIEVAVFVWISPIWR
jgi:hypothetical protein